MLFFIQQQNSSVAFPLAQFPHIDAVPVLARFNVQMSSIFGSVSPLGMGFLESCNSDEFRNTYIPVPSVDDGNDYLDGDSDEVYLGPDEKTTMTAMKNEFQRFMTQVNQMKAYAVFSNTTRAAAANVPRPLVGPTLQMEKLLHAATIGSDFDAFTFHNATYGAPLYVLSMHLFRLHGFLAPSSGASSTRPVSLLTNDSFGVFPMEKVSRFFAEIEASYLPYAYHNQKHATDVLQLAHLIFTSSRMRLHGQPSFLTSEIAQSDRIRATLTDIYSLAPEGSSFGFTRLELLALLISAAIHDVGHVGTNNAFQAKTRSPLSTFYNDQSVLENNHLATAFSILRKPECDFVSVLPAEERARLRSMIIHLVLATDLAEHKKHTTEVAEVLAALDAKEKETGTFSPEETQRLALLKIVLKCSDVGHPARPTAVHEMWSDSIQTEFFAQGDQERALGYEVVGPLNRFGDSLAKGQIGFINFLVKPMFSLLNSPVITISQKAKKNTFTSANDPNGVYADVSPDSNGEVEVLTPWVHNLEGNLKHWTKLAAAESK